MRISKKQGRKRGTSDPCFFEILMAKSASLKKSRKNDFVYFGEISVRGAPLNRDPQASTQKMRWTRPAQVTIRRQLVKTGKQLDATGLKEHSASSCGQGWIGDQFILLASCGVGRLGVEAEALAGVIFRIECFGSGGNHGYSMRPGQWFGSDRWCSGRSQWS